MMVVGLVSGMQLITQDKSFFIQVGQSEKQVFVSPDGKRRFTVAIEQIEYHDEVNTEEYMGKIQESVKKTEDKRKSTDYGVDYV